MPFILNTTINGTNYPLSFWIIALVSMNHIERTAIVHVNGYASVEDYNAGNAFISQQPVIFNDGSLYDSYVRFQFERPDNVFSFYVYLETAILAATTFFVGSQPYSVTQPISLEVGQENDNRINVGFSNTLTGINSGGGATIKINGTPATITGAAANGLFSFPPSYVVYYDISPSPVTGDVVTWSYDGGAVFGGSGTLTDPSLNPVYKFTGLSVDSTIGERLRFSKKSNSSQLITLGVF